MKPMFASAPFRALIAVLVTAGMQLCCCSAAWLGCAACDDQGDEALLAAEGGHNHDLIAKHGHDDQIPGSHSDGSPCGGHDGNHDKGKCTCSTQDPKPRPSEPPKIDLPLPVLVAVLPAWDPLPPNARGSRELTLLDRLLVRPATSLLRQHCALIV